MEEASAGLDPGWAVVLGAVIAAFVAAGTAWVNSYFQHRLERASDTRRVRRDIYLRFMTSSRDFFDSFATGIAAENEARESGDEFDVDRHMINFREYEHIRRELELFASKAVRTPAIQMLDDWIEWIMTLDPEQPIAGHADAYKKMESQYAHIVEMMRSEIGAE